MYLYNDLLKNVSLSSQIDFPIKGSKVLVKL